MARSVQWNLIANPRQFERGFDRAEKKARGFKTSMGGVGRALAGAFAFTTVVAGVKTLTDAAKESQLVASQTAAVIKSTGGAAGVSAKGFADLATAISKKVAVDDEVIQSGENILATFTNIKNSGPDKVFDQATMAAVDMAAALNNGEVTAEGLQSANIQLGKALNDPIKGISALTRVGVSFTDAQKDQIKAMVEAGDTAGAQKVILAELSKEFGGSAEAAKTSGKELSVAWGNAQEVLGGMLVPAIEKAQELLISFIGLVDRNREVFVALGVVIGVVTGLILANTIATKVKVAWDTAWAAGTAVVTAAQWALNAALNANPIGLVVLAIALLVAGLVIAYKKSDTFRKIVDTAFRAVATAGKWMWENVLKPAFEKLVVAFQAVGTAASTLWSKVLKPTFKFIVEAWLAVAGFIVEGAATAFGWVPGLGDKLRTAADKFKTFKDKVNTQLGLIDDEGVAVNLKSTFQPPKGFSMRSIVGAQRGMRIPGYGGGDRVPIMAEAGEAVVPKHLAATAGFQGWAGAHGIPGFAAGGVVPRLFSASKMAATQEGVDRRVAAKVAAGIAGNFKLLLGGGPGIQGALRWARSQVGKPYLWGGVGPGGYDCSGFMSAITNVVMGRSPYRRLFATGSFPASGWASGFSPLGFSIGSRRGNPGHMAGTLGGVNVESSGSVGVRVGGAARGARSGLFGGNIWHLAGQSGASPGSHERFVGFDKGGWLAPGATLAVNNTGRPEPVGFDYEKMADAFVAALERRPPAVYLDRQKVSRAVRDGDLWEARR